MRRPSFQRVAQAASLGLFLCLLIRAGRGGTESLLPVDLFLRLDPAIGVVTWLAGRAWIGGLWLCLLALGACLLAGRLFCGHLCPLGATLDFGRKLLAPGTDAPRPSIPADASRRRWKYLLLLALLVAAALGVSFAFVASPLSLATRFWGLLGFPTLARGAAETLELLRPAFGALGWNALYFAKVPFDRFATQLFVLGFLVLLFWLETVRPRFWCRYLCPSGALFALFSRRPLARRCVSEACVECGKCARSCPMGAIPEDFRRTRFAECVVCETCVRVCPTRAIRFAIPAFARTVEAQPALPDPAPRSSRRAFLGAGLAGAGSAALALTGISSPHLPQGVGAVRNRFLLRPPGSLPEDDLLARCIRCGECMKACPTNTLQPIWLEAGFSGLFSPAVVPRRAPCDPLCTVCGHVCPTGAIRPLAPDDRVAAKIGTAAVLRHKCLAWEQQRQCLVCDEVCPYDAIELRRVPDNPVPVPFVNESRCAGCGFCEHLCPVQNAAAIVVEPAAALRLKSGSYREAARNQGLDLRLRKAEPGHPEAGAQPAGEGFPPGFSEPPASDGSGGLPPGFSEPATSSGSGGLPPGFSEPWASPSPAEGEGLPPGFSETK